MALQAILLGSVLNPWEVHLRALDFTHSSKHLQVGCITHIRHNAKRNKSSSKSPHGRAYIDHSIEFLRFFKHNKPRVPYTPHAYNRDYLLVLLALTNSLNIGM